MRALALALPLVLMLAPLDAAPASVGRAAAGSDDFQSAVSLARAGDGPGAIALFAQLAEAGHPAAQANLAVMLARGQGRPQDDAGAAYWAWRARLGGETRAMDLSDHLLNRLTTAARADLAARLAEDLGRMADDGDRAALVGLGRIALQLRQPPSIEDAVKWFTVAAALGVPGAASLRDLTAQDLTAEARLAAQTHAAEAFDGWCAAQSIMPRPASCPPF